METVDLLRADHALLRRKGVLLESALQIGPKARLALRDMSYSLMRMLDTHLQREAHIFQQYYSRTGSHEPLPASDHSVERHLLRSANRLLNGHLRASIPMIILRLSQALEQLRVQMDRQERSIFPWLGAQATLDDPGSMPLDGTMSVNEVLHRYPRAREIFEELCINRLDEGSDSVDEVAWRHGIDAAEVLERLRSAVAGVPSYWYGE